MFSSGIFGFYDEPTQGEPWPLVDALVGDYNDSGSVEQGDLDLVLNNWGQTRTFDPSGDAFATDAVDQEELDRVLNNWGSVTCSPCMTIYSSRATICPRCQR